MNEEVIFEIKAVYEESLSNTDVNTINLNTVYNPKLDDLISLDTTAISVNEVNKLSVSDDLSPQNVYLGGLTMIFIGVMLFLKGIV